jgi:hypothetical protein
VTAPIVLPWPLQSGLEAATRTLFDLGAQSSVDFLEPVGEAALVPHDSVSWCVFKNPAACAFSLRLVAWSHIWNSSTSNVLLNRGLERVGELPIDLAVARLRHIAGTRWSTKRYPNMELLRQRNAITAQLEHATDKSAKDSGHYRLQIR